MWGCKHIDESVNMSSDVWMMPQINPGSLRFHPCRLTSVNFTICVQCVCKRRRQRRQSSSHTNMTSSVCWEWGGTGSHPTKTCRWVRGKKKNKSSLTFNQQIFQQSFRFCISTVGSSRLQITSFKISLSDVPQPRSVDGFIVAAGQIPPYPQLAVCHLKQTHMITHTYVLCP